MVFPRNWREDGFTFGGMPGEAAVFGRALKPQEISLF